MLFTLFCPNYHDNSTHADANTAAPSHTALLPGRPIDNTMDSSSTEVINATTSFPERTLTTLKRDDMTDSVSGWARYKQLIIGVSICGTILMLLCICIIATVAIFIRARKRKRVGCETTDGQSSENKICPKLTWFSFRNHQPGSAGDLLNVGSSATCGIHMTSLLTESLSANTEQEHSYAYISSDIIHPNPKPLCRNRPPTLPPARIAVRHNPCYSSTPATSTEDLDQKSESAVADEKRVENVYDLPVFTIRPRQAREYEVPVKSLPKSTPKVVREKQHIYELTDKNEYV